MNEYWKEQAGLTHDEKQAFVERVQAEQADFLHSLRTITQRSRKPHADTGSDCAGRGR